MFLGHFGLGFGAKKAAPTVSLGALFLACQLANVFGPPPTSVNAIGWAAQAMWLLVIWGYWIDRHRTASS
ncbi:MAG TPA: hypothetical protein VHU82_00470 [Vicinamibacterales bacterium]|jgi:hypothetical protein|nr:hypothetical protein [Vicinamibacterales bacterium]